MFNKYTVKPEKQFAIIYSNTEEQIYGKLRKIKTITNYAFFL